MTRSVCSFLSNRCFDSAGKFFAIGMMAVQFDRILESMEGPFEELHGPVAPPAAQIANREGAAGFFLDPRLNDSFRVVNRLLAAGQEVRRL